MSGGHAALASPPADGGGASRAVAARPRLRVVTAAGASRRRFGMRHGLLLSLLVHGAVALPLLAGDWLRPSPPRRDPLVFELFGMVSNRQAAQQELGTPEARAAMTANKPAPTPKAAPKPPVVKLDTPPPRALQASSPVVVAKAAEQAEPAPQPAPPAEQQAPTVQGAQQAQVQQTLQRQPTEADLIRQYAMSLTRTIRDKLVYPPELRATGHVGTPLVRFVVTESGEVLPGSLVMARSSGHADLDAAALKAVAAMVPFPRPPRQMPVGVPIEFYD